MLPTGPSELFKMCQMLELPKSVVNLRAREIRQPFKTEFLHVERCHDGAKNNSSSEYALADLAGMRQCAHETAGKRVTGARRVEDVLQRERGRSEYRLAVEHQNSI